MFQKISQMDDVYNKEKKYNKIEKEVQYGLQSIDSRRSRHTKTIV